MELHARIADDEQRRAWRVLNVTFMKVRGTVRGHERFGDWPIPNDPASTAVDPTRFIVSGRGLGADVGAGRVLAGHRLLPTSVPQTLPSEAELSPCIVGAEPCTFSVQAHDSSGAPVAHDDADFFARLYGDALFDVPVVSVGGGRYEARFDPREVGAGTFIVEVRCTWLEGAGNEPDLAITRLPYFLDEVVFRSQHLLVVAMPVAAAPVPLPAKTPACTSADPGPGRWQHLVGGVCAPPFCTGQDLSTSQINDGVGLNRDLVWVPRACHFHIYSPPELGTCFRGCGLRKFEFGGDSIAREHVQNLALLLSGFSAEGGALPRVRGPDTSGNSMTVPVAGSDWAVVIEYIPSERPSGGADVTLFNLREAHALAGGVLLNGDEERSYKARLANFASNACGRAPHMRCFFYLNPRIQGEKSYIVDRNGTGRESFGIKTTSRRMARYDAWAREFQAANPDLASRLLFLDGLEPTRAHWLGNWDGMHNSISGL